MGEEGAEVEEVEVILQVADRGRVLCSTFLRRTETSFPAICDTSGNGSCASISTP